MIARAGAAPPAQAPLVLKNVMADLMREDMAEHEALQRIARPGQDTVLAKVCARVTEYCSLLLRQRVWKAPRRYWLVVEANATRSDERSKEKPPIGGRGWDQLYGFESVVDLLTEGRKRAADVRRRDRMMAPWTCTPYADHRKRRPSRSTNLTWVTSKAVSHSRMMTSPLWNPTRACGRRRLPLLQPSRDHPAAVRPIAEGDPPDRQALHRRFGRLSG